MNYYIKTYYCKTCERTKRFDKFYPPNQNGIRKEYSCKECTLVKRRQKYHANKEHFVAQSRKYRQRNRDNVLHNKRKQTYGITKDQYNYLLKLQKGVCAICHLPERVKVGKGPMKDKIAALSVDHEHHPKDTKYKKYGKIRGLLCSNCNRAYGYLKEDINIMKRMIAYTRKYQK